MNGSGQAAGTRIVLLTVVVVIAVLKVAEDVFVPLALALLLTFMLAPLVERLHQFHINRTLGVVASIVLALTLIAGLGDLVVNQVSDLARSLPSYQSQLRHRVVELRGVLKVGVSETTKVVEQLTKEFERVAPPEQRAHGQRVLADAADHHVAAGFDALGDGDLALAR